MYPFERFTERAKKVLTLAQEEAERSHHSYIGTEHLLLGLLREGEGLAAKVLNNLGAADGLIHISELSWDRVANVADVLTVGQEVQVKVIKLDPDTSRISLSLRQLGQDPWDHIEKRFPPGAIVEGEVTKIKKYGAFLQIGDGIEGLLHISELAWEHVEHTEDVVQVGQKLRVRVLQADRSRRRISLSLKQAEEPTAGARPEDADVSDYPGEIERVPESEREPAYAEVSAAPQE